ncbi:shikimate kinase [bacterium]|nr:shikimate kinase [bacterium]
MFNESNLYLIGMMGAGKSTVGKALADKLHRPYMDSDDEIEKLAQKSISKIFKSDGEGFFRHLEGRVIRGLSARTSLIASLGGGAVMHEINMTRLKVSGTLIWLDFPIDVLLDRIKNHNHRPLLANSSNTGKTKLLHKLHKERLTAYKQAHIHMAFKKELPASDIADIIIHKIQK